MKPYVDRLQVENFACIKSVNITLTPLHAFIGPNDSGKSTLLRAMSFASNVNIATPFPAPPVQWPSRTARMSLHWSDGSFLQMAASEGISGERPATASQGAQLLRLEPDAMRAASPLIPRGQTVMFRDMRGLGLASVLDAMSSRHPERWVTLRNEFKSLFPGVERVEVQNDSDRTKALGAVLNDGTEVGSTQMSEGMLYWLAFKALEYAGKPAVLLVEEPENGLHPARVAEIMGILRRVSAETQVVIATHSPLVVNELKPDEVTIITRTAEAGTIATPMTKTKNFAQRSSIYALGELWLSYADGELERELMPEPTKDTKAAG